MSARDRLNTPKTIQHKPQGLEEQPHGDTPTSEFPITRAHEISQEEEQVFTLPQRTNRNFYESNKN